MLSLQPQINTVGTEFPTALPAGLHGDLSEDVRAAKFSSHSLRAGLSPSAEVGEHHVQKQLGHARAEMNRRYHRRRDRFRVNLTKASGLQESYPASMRASIFLMWSCAP
ncbi:hypothetical protein BHMPCIPO_05560 [Ensifer sesbaniae]|nr:hypothetical protein [Ensifer sesbaniae]